MRYQRLPREGGLIADEGHVGVELQHGGRDFRGHGAEEGLAQDLRLVRAGEHHDAGRLHPKDSLKLIDGHSPRFYRILGHNDICMKHRIISPHIFSQIMLHTSGLQM